MSFCNKLYTADLHFGHALMLDPAACGRPFASVDEMDEALISNWNRAVRKDDDLVYVLGDFSMGLKDEGRVRHVFERLRGRKILVLGNHDYAKRNRVHPAISGLEWEDVAQHYETTDEGERIFLSHYAQRTWPGAHRGAWHFFGHNHGRLPPLGRSRDVGVDCPDAGFSPRTFRQLTAGMRTAPVAEPVLEECAP